MDWDATRQTAFSDCLSRRNLLRLGSFWLTGVVLVVAHTVWSGRSEIEAVSSADGLPVLECNETGALTVWLKAPSPGAGPAYRVVFDNLRVENGNLGVFKAAADKVVYVDNLQASFFSQDSSDVVSMELSGLHDLFAPRRDAPEGVQPLGLFEELQAQNADWSVPVDMANTTEVRIRRLDWQVCRGDRTVFRIRCQHAVLHSETPKMVLRGRVVVGTAGAVLESNCVEIDVPNGSITVPGRYTLRSNGTMRTGLGQHLSATLTPASGESPDKHPDATAPQEDKPTYIDPSAQPALNVYARAIATLRNFVEWDMVAPGPIVVTETYEVRDDDSASIGELVLAFDGDPGAIADASLHLWRRSILPHEDDTITRSDGESGARPICEGVSGGAVEGDLVRLAGAG
jgi:hypothetical protein